MDPPLPARILALMEAESVTGPAKNLISFAHWLQSPEGMQSELRVAIATFDRKRSTERENAFIRASRAAGIDTHAIPERHALDTRVVPSLRKLITTLDPHIVQTHNIKSHLLIKSMPDLRSGRLWFAFHHGYTDTDLKQRLYNQIDRVTLRSADRVITVCQAFVPGLEAFGVDPGRIRILHNAAVSVPLPSGNDAAGVRQRFGIGVDEALILVVARLSREKGHRHLLRALARLRSARPWKLLLVGDGPERDAIGGLARALGLGERLVFAGFHREIAAFYAAADILALPSLSEGSSNVLLEAMAAGLPIVASRAGGNPEVAIDEETALIVPTADPNRLMIAIERLLMQPDLARRLADAGRARASTEFSLATYRRRLLTYYGEARTMLGGRGRARSGSSAAPPIDGA